MKMISDSEDIYQFRSKIQLSQRETNESGAVPNQPN